MEKNYRGRNNLKREELELSRTKKLSSDRRFIEEYLPIEKLGKFATREGKMGQGRISNIHRWWARRRQGLCRSLLFASLIKSTENVGEIKEIIENLAPFKAGNDEALLKRVIAKINKNGDNSSLKFWDPFAGGGTIPLEAGRLGLKVYASDLNPVACLILEATLRFPQKLGMVKLAETQLTKIIKTKKEKLSKSKSILGELIRKWGKWLIDQAKPEVDKLPFTYI